MISKSKFADAIRAAKAAKSTEQVAAVKADYIEDTRVLKAGTKYSPIKIGILIAVIAVLAKYLKLFKR